MDYFIVSYFVTGLILAFFYDTWFIAFGVGGLSLVAYYSAKFALPKSDLYQYVLSLVFGIFMAQYIYQMHGMFEMNFIAFISSALLIVYQNWKLQIPILILVVVHHGIFGYLQNSGLDYIYFTKLDYMDWQTFIIHILLAGVIFFICGLWAYQLKQYSDKDYEQTLEMGKLQKEALLAMSEHLKSTNERLNEARKIAIERKLNEDALEISNKELRKSNLELDNFVYSVSHDLRAPLTSMLGLVEITEDEVEDSFVLTNLRMLKGSIKKLDGLIHDILNYSRNSRLEVMREEINMEEMLPPIISHMETVNQINRTVEFNIDFKNDSIFFSDKLRLSLVLKKLVSNAIQYQNPKTLQPHVNINVETNDKEAHITIKDNGLGIKKELQGKIFQMFYRVSQHSEGSGLGLYIVKETVEKLNGRIEIISELGIGTTFSVIIPNNK